MKIGIDLLGSDTSPQTLYDGVLQVLQEIQEKVTFYLYGTEGLFKTLPHHPALVFELCDNAIEIDENPLSAIRMKKNSTLVRGINDLKAGTINALISCGNTGALIALATIKLDLLPGIDRPALMATLPTQKGYTYVVDVGGNSAMNREHLIQFTKLGVAHLKKHLGIPHPRVALLNIGTESLKGTPEHQRLFDHLKTHQEGFEFVGNTEGRQVFSGDIDLVVTDGFTGNVFLKTAEGAAHFLIQELQNQLSKEENLLLTPHFKRFGERFSQNVYPGALVLGLKQHLVKCHGSTTSGTIKNALLEVIKGA